MSGYSDFQGERQNETGSSAPIDFYEYAAQQNKRDADSRIDYNISKVRLRPRSYPEICERCGRDLEARVHIWNGKKLCINCLEDEKGTWDLFTEGPNAVPQRILIQHQDQSQGPRFIESFVSWILAVFGLKRIEKDLSIVEQIPKKLAKLLDVHRPDRKQVPDDEGIMGGRMRKIRLPHAAGA